MLVVVELRAVGHRQATRYSAGGNKRTSLAASPSAPAADTAAADTAAVVAAALAAAALAAAPAFAARWAWRRSERAEVHGDSMVPALEPGDRLLIWHTKRLKTGDVVAAGDPRDPGRTLLKRAAAFEDGGIYLLGDNERRSTDSRHFGPVPWRLVRGKAVYRYAPRQRTGRLPAAPGVGPPAGPHHGRHRHDS